MIEVVQLPALDDNYIYIFHEPVSGLTAVVDPGESPQVEALLVRRGWHLDAIFVTHHHPDHVGGILALQRAHQCVVHGSRKDRARIPGIVKEWGEGDVFRFGAEQVRVFGADGHTRGHIIYWFPDSGVVFVGDTLFSIGCGRLFEGTPQEMWAILSRLRDLPPETVVYSAHEYTAHNAAFALLIEPSNGALQRRAEDVRQLRLRQCPTVPTTVGEERSFNPFLRPESAEIRRNVDKCGDELWMVFGSTRATKDRFDRTGSIAK